MKKLMALVLSAFVAGSCFGEASSGPDGDFYTNYMTMRTSMVPPEPGRVPAQLVDFRLDHLQDADESGTETNTYHYGSFVTDFAHDYYSPRSRNFRTLQHFIDWLDWRLSFYPPLDGPTLGDRWKWLFKPYPNEYEQSTLGIFDWLDDNGPYVQGTNILAGYNDATWTIHSEDPNHFWQWGPYLYGTSISGASNGSVTKATFDADNMTYGPFLLGMGVKGASNNVVSTNTLNDGQFYGPFLLGQGINGASNGVVTANTLTDGTNYGPFLLGTGIMGASNGTTSVDTCTDGVYGPFLAGTGILGGTPTGTVVNTCSTNGEYGPFLMGTNILGGEFTNGQWEVSAGLYPDTAERLYFNTDGVVTNDDFLDNKAFRYVFRGAIWYSTADNDTEFSYDLVVVNDDPLINAANGNNLSGTNVLGVGTQGWLQRPVVFRGLRFCTGGYTNNPGTTNRNKIVTTRANFDKIASSYATLCLRYVASEDATPVFGIYSVTKVKFFKDGDANRAELTLDRNLEASLLEKGGRFYLCGEIGQFGMPAMANRICIVTSQSGLDKTKFIGVVRATSRKRNPWLPD